MKLQARVYEPDDCGNGHFMMTVEEQEEFNHLMAPLAGDPRVLRMRQYIQHGRVTTYDHCLAVARTSYELNLRLHLHAHVGELLRAAFLHDYFLYDWHTRGDHLHGYHHPGIAAGNADRDFHLTKRERSCIETHMWPLTLFHMPSSKEAWIITLADKICSTRETLTKRRTAPETVLHKGV